MKKYRSRKKKALRRSAWITLLVVLLCLTNAVNFLPRQAVRDIADMQNMGELEVVRSFYDNKLKTYRRARQFLVDGEKGLLLCAVGWDPFMGWYDRDWCAVSTDDGNGIHMGYRGHQQGEVYSGYFFGRLDDENIVQVKLRWKDAGEENAEHWCEKILDADAFFRGENGKRYILWEADSFDATNTRWFQGMTAYAYDEEGKLLAEEEVRWHDWGTVE